MKTAVIFIGLFCAYVTAEEPEECPIKKMLEQHFDECAKSMKPSEETLQFVREAKTGEDTTEVKCFRACMMKSLGFMENAKLKIDKMEELLKTSEKLSEEHRNVIMGLLKECQPEAEVSENDCEVAGNYHRCMDTKVKAIKSKQ